MPSKKSVAKEGSGQKEKTVSAIKRGRERAIEVMAVRARQRRKRARVIAEIAARPVRRIPERTRRALVPSGSTGQDDHGFDVESVDHKGDRVEDMAYSGGQFEEFARWLEKLWRQGRIPDAILLSGGGNDIAGEEFATLLNHAASGLPVINDDVVRGVLDVRLRNAYEFLIGGLTDISKQFLGRPIPILIHGYDYPIPDGRGFLGGFGFLPGPWLRPGFHKKDHADQPKNVTVMRDLIDRFNRMLQQVSSTPEFGHMRFLDLRNTLSGHVKTYRKDWASELHPTPRGFVTVTNKIAGVIAGL